MKSIATSILSLLLCITLTKLYAQFAPQKVIESCEICGLENIEWADLDGDGLKDIFTTSINDNQLIWLKNEGKGKYSKPIVIFNQVWGLVNGKLADIDADGDLDVLAIGHKVKTRLKRGVFIIINEGGGVFRDNQVFLWSESQDASFVVAEDMDQDQDIDLLTASNASGRIVWYRNDGTGVFDWVNYLSPDQFSLTSIQMTDLDNDQDKDILISYYYAVTDYPGYRWFRNEGKGVYTYQKEIYYFLNPSPGINSTVTAQDVNGDQKIDLIGSTSYHIEIHLNLGNGDFATRSILIPLLENIPAYYFNVVDMDADGYVDIVFAGDRSTGSANEVENAIWWSKNLGNERYALPQMLTTTSGKIRSVRVLDIDADQDPDILYGFLRFDGIHVLRNNGTLNFSDESINTSKLGGLLSSSVVDLDGDRKNDLVSASFFDHKIAWYKNIGAGKFSEQKIISDQISGLQSVKTGDLDGDRDIDIVAFHRVDRLTMGIIWFRNDKNNGFSKQTYIHLGDPLNYLAEFPLVVDVDNDQDGDILFLSDFKKNLVFIKNEGGGKFAKPALIDQGIFFEDFNFLTAADLNKDNYIDIVVRKNGNLSWYKNKKDGSFEPAAILAQYGGKLRTGDFDFDGDIDFVSLDGKFDLYTNDGNANFSVRTIIKIDYIGIFDFQAADFDGDQDLDLVISSKIDAYNITSWYENTASGLWKNHEIYNKEGIEANFLEVGDMDEDGDMDVVFFNESFNEIAWFENRFNYPTISGTVYWDENENGQFDPTERVLKNIPVSLSPQANSTFTGEDGKFKFYAPRGLYRVSANPDSCWELTTPSPIYTVLFDGSRPLSREFGYKLSAKAENAQPRIFSSATRCGFEAPFIVSLENSGCVPSKGKYGLVLSPRLTLLSSSIPPDQIRGDTLLWNYRNLLGAEITQQTMNFRIAGPEFIGDTIKLTGLAYTENENGQLQLANTYDYSSEIRCAYDPNDKLTFPNRRNTYPRNYTLFKEEMEFLVRFQNTGNDTAFTVVIRDTLDKNLDWSTFRPLAGSHPFETHIQENGALSFTFKNILLPDSKTNEPLSHGFVSYRISPTKGLPEQTEILNTAYIYFDFNPPIQTNTTSNVMVSSLPRTTRTKDINSSLDYKLYPNPFDDELLLEISAVIGGGDYSFSLINSQSQIVQHKKVTRDIEQIDTKHLPSGLYFYLIKNPQGRIVASGKVVCR